jgi:hypothetical protein
MALNSTQPLTEMSTYFAESSWQAKGDSLTAICEPIIYKMWKPRRLTALRISKACYRDSFTFLLFNIHGSNIALCIGKLQLSQNTNGYHQYTFTLPSSCIIPSGFYDTSHCIHGAQLHSPRNSLG